MEKFDDEIFDLIINTTFFGRNVGYYAGLLLAKPREMHKKIFL